MSTNIEARARALCAADLRPSVAAGDLEVAVDRLWPVVAREIQGDVMDRDAIKEPRDIAVRVVEYQRLRR
ncbi:hypothetical protein LGR54_15645 [Ancylobacter sp. Lp-2]|uniref:hypothetical protein n=1 Tax=Ancylobacter sp. Lp-2 TaxID=2881339 RepID=UPI001E296124|nr:hypothetical protein [Ancylobacter sp. Lp-2]MCB4770051.1 hypothetical protein [Ancylobacter sp. Lp-2]